MTPDRKKKVFVATDERCGGTTIKNIFNNSFKWPAISDPQTRTHEKLPNFKGDRYSTDLLEHAFFEAGYEVVKCCYKSFANEQYIGLIQYCVEHQIAILQLHRSNTFERALSLVVARATKNYGIKNPNEMKPFNIDIDDYVHEINRYVKDFNYVRSFLINKSIDHIFCTMAQIYRGKDLLSTWKTIAQNVGVEEDLLDKKSFWNYVNRDYNTSAHNELILNLSEINRVNRSLLHLQYLNPDVKT